MQRIMSNSTQKAGVTAASRITVTNAQIARVEEAVERLLHGSCMEKLAVMFQAQNRLRAANLDIETLRDARVLLELAISLVDAELLAQQERRLG